MSKALQLLNHFQPERYELDSPQGQIKISGKKVGPPSKRITLHQKGLKITNAQIVRRDKKGDREFSIARINHLPTFEQVRLHTRETLFPGHYEVIIDFSNSHKPSPEAPKREQFPCIDEPEAWESARTI